MKKQEPKLVAIERKDDLAFHGINLTHTRLSLWPSRKILNTDIKPLVFIFIQFALLSLQFTLFYTDFGHLIDQVNSVNLRLI